VYGSLDCFRGCGNRLLDGTNKWTLEWTSAYIIDLAWLIIREGRKVGRSMAVVFHLFARPRPMLARA